MDSFVDGSCIFSLHAPGGLVSLDAPTGASFGAEIALEGAGGG